ncbi:MAG: elongation factor P [Puniceicoccaceae bacterium 5H]|nr:MAG: elongation factor P [Puniceicoccaceae bacterium 5H]
MANPNDVRKGNCILYNNVPHLVLGVDHRTPGRRMAFVQLTMRNLNTGSSTVTKLFSNDSVDILTTDTKKMEFSYIDPMGYHFLDPETFEDVVMQESDVENAKDFLVEGGMIDILFVDGKAVQIQLPASVEMDVEEAPDAVRGDTSGNVLKPVVTATGVTVMTPLFIKKGDRIKVSTEDKSYLGRVNS